MTKKEYEQALAVAKINSKMIIKDLCYPKDIYKLAITMIDKATTLEAVEHAKSTARQKMSLKETQREKMLSELRKTYGQGLPGRESINETKQKLKSITTVKNGQRKSAAV